MSIQTTYTAAKETKRGTRIWIEGQKLSLSGFTPDALYLKAVSYTHLTLPTKRIV